MATRPATTGAVARHRAFVIRLACGLAVALTLGSAGRAFAEPPGIGAGGPRAAEVIRKIEAARIAALTAQLGLDEKTATTLAGVLDSFDPEFVAAARDRGAYRKTLAAYASGAAGTPDQVHAALEGLFAARAKIEDIDRRRLEAAAAVLTPQQAAELFLVLPRVEGMLRRAVARAKGRPGLWRDPGGGPPEDPVLR